MCDFEGSDPVVVLLNVVCPVASPQLTSTAHGLSLTPGSVNEPRLKLWLSPSFEDWFAGAVTVGATLLIVTDAVYSVVPPSLSRIFPFTVRVPLSVVGQLAVFDKPNAP